MTRFFAIACMFILFACLSACGDKEDSSPDTEEEAETEQGVATRTDIVLDLHSLHS